MTRSERDECADQAEVAWLDAVDQLPPVSAPRGFSDRVLARVQQGEAPRRTSPSSEPLRSGWSRRRSGAGRSPAWGWAALAAAAVVLAIWVPNLNRSDERGDLATAGPAGRLGMEPHLVVRPAGDGERHAADMVAFVSAVEARGGLVERREATVWAQLPRGELVAFVQDLARRGRFEVRRQTLPEGVDLLWIRFEAE